MKPKGDDEMMTSGSALFARAADRFSAARYNYSIFRGKMVCEMVAEGGIEPPTCGL